VFDLGLEQSRTALGRRYEKRVGAKALLCMAFFSLYFARGSFQVSVGKHKALLSSCRTILSFGCFSEYLKCTITLDQIVISCHYLDSYIPD
jgi:hypothetical protein